MAQNRPLADNLDEDAGEERAQAKQGERQSCPLHRMGSRGGTGHRPLEGWMDGWMGSR